MARSRSGSRNTTEAGLRQRSDDLKISRLTIDEISGLQCGYSAKLLCSQPVRGLGKTSLGPILGAMGLALVVIEDTQQLEKIRTEVVAKG